jgi:hypothetical protein
MAGGSTLAQSTSVPSSDTTWTDWTVQQHCADSATLPPEGWTFDGTFFTISSEGIRAFRADFPTTYFISQGGDDFIYSAAISPDGKWLAVPHGVIETQVNTVNDSHYEVQEIRLYHTTPDATLAKQIDYSALYLYVSSVFPEKVVPVFWFDNQTMIVDGGRPLASAQVYESLGALSINIIDGEVKHITSKTTLYHYPNLSPDLTRIISARYNSFNEVYGLYNLETDQLQFEFPVNQWKNAGWTPDSAIVAVQTVNENYRQMGIIFISRDGSPLDTVITGQDDIFASNFEWSPDGNQFGLIIHRQISKGANPGLDVWSRTLYLGDMQKRTLTHTCIGDIEDYVWKFDNQQIAIAPGDENYNKFGLIFDLDQNNLYQIESFKGDLMGWYPNEKSLVPGNE